MSEPVSQPEYKCPFSIIQTSGLCHCQFSDEVIRRGGSEFNCKKPDAHKVCTSLTQHLNATSLPALGYEDDLTLTPKSIYERILVGYKDCEWQKIQTIAARKLLIYGL